MIADDTLPFARGLSDMLTEIGIEVVRIAGDAEELLAFVDEDPPDVVIVDVRMRPDFSDEGLRVAETLEDRHPTVGVLVISAYDEYGWATRLLQRRRRGVGYLQKRNLDDIAVVRDALRRIRAGGVAIDPEIAANLLTRRSNALESLTPREGEVLRLVAEGRSNQNIATLMHVHERTVENHVGNVFRKLGLARDGAANLRVLAVLEFQRSEGPADQHRP